MLDDSRSWDIHRQRYGERKQCFTKTKGGESGVSYNETSFREQLLKYSKIDHKYGYTTLNILKTLKSRT